MEVIIPIAGLCATALLAWYIYILMKGEDRG